MWAIASIKEDYLGFVIFLRSRGLSLTFSDAYKDLELQRLDWTGIEDFSRNCRSEILVMR
jgi:hypothetical protein